MTDQHTPRSPEAAEHRRPTIGFVSLGCPKALVDSERILTRLRAEGYEIAPSYEGADAVVVNTCGFIDSARAESFDAIREAMRENGNVIVTGCLGADEAGVREVAPGVLDVSGPHQYERVMEAVHKAVPPAHDPHIDLLPPGGIKLTPRHYAYLKIAEGCHNRCSFCIIPHLRGDLVSRPIDAVLREGEALVRAGVKELLVVSQDTSAYGLDLKYEPREWRGESYETRFLDLARGLGALGVWVRMHYLYPYPHVDHVLPLMAEGRVLPYLDIPFQHAHPDVLRAMRRPAHQEKILARIENWRKTCPDLAIRSTFIVGFPGETEEQFSFLLDWLKEARLDRVGAFRFEPVDGAAANALEGALPDEVKDERYQRLMDVQNAIALEKQEAKIGRVLDVIVDEVDDEGAIARSKADAPEIDGTVFVENGQSLKPGDLARVRVHSADAYDLWANLEDGA